MATGFMQSQTSIQTSLFKRVQAQANIKAVGGGMSVF